MFIEREHITGIYLHICFAFRRLNSDSAILRKYAERTSICSFRKTLTIFVTDAL